MDETGILKVVYNLYLDLALGHLDGGDLRKWKC
jgi:hypothetical protein